MHDNWNVPSQVVMVTFWHFLPLEFRHWLWHLKNCSLSYVVNHQCHWKLLLKFFSTLLVRMLFFFLKVLSNGNEGGSKLVSVDSSIPYDVLSCRQVSFFLAPRDTITRGASFSVALVLFDAIPTWLDDKNTICLYALLICAWSLSNIKIHLGQA